MALAIGGQLSFKETRRFSSLFAAERLLERASLLPSALAGEAAPPTEPTGLAPGTFVEILVGLTPITPKSWFILGL